MVLQKVTQMIAKEFNLDISTLNRETRLEEDLSIDSLDAVELVMGLEDTFNVSISDLEAQRSKTVGQIADFVAAKMG